jgi:serine/threonine-protein kinase
MTMTTPRAADEVERRARVNERPHPLLDEIVEGRYRVVERIGSGGMGAVYRVEHLRLRRHFALKLLRAELCDEPGMVQRFERESRLAASVRSEHVVGIVDSGTSSAGIPYFVMELGDSDLRRVLRSEGSLAPVRVANLGIDTCQGLVAAHDNGLVHRDLKPENLLLARGDDGREIAKIADFGVAKALGVHSTQPGSLVGTVRYMAPEQVGSSEPVGPATDIYALGVILYECLSGAVPFEEETTERTLYRIMTDRPEPLRARCPELPPGLAAVVDRALERAPAARHESARAFAEALLPFAGVQRTGAGVPSVAVTSRADSDTARLAEGLQLGDAVDAVEGRTKPTPAWPRTALIALGSAVAGAALATLAAPRTETAPLVQPRAAPVASTPPSSSTSPRVPTPDASDRASSPPSVPVRTAGSAADAATIAARAPTASARTRAPRPAAVPSAAETRPRRQPPSASFDPSNPYGP